MMSSNTVNPKGMSPSCMKHVTVLLVYSLKFTHVKMKGPKKLIQPQKPKECFQPMGFFYSSIPFKDLC